MNLICGINPVLEALAAGTRHFDRLLVVKGLRSRRLSDAIRRATHLGIPLRFEMRETLDRMAGGVPHQGIIAVVSEKPVLVAREPARRRPTTPALLVVLDGVEDPRNLGAILRTAEAAGADGVLLPERHSAGLSETVARASAGALEHVKVARVGNLVQALEALKARGLWVVGFDAAGTERWDAVDLAPPGGARPRRRGARHPAPRARALRPPRLDPALRPRRARSTSRWRRASPSTRPCASGGAVPSLVRPIPARPRRRRADRRARAGRRRRPTPARGPCRARRGRARATERRRRGGEPRDRTSTRTTTWPGARARPCSSRSASSACGADRRARGKRRAAGGRRREARRRAARRPRRGPASAGAAGRRRRASAGRRRGSGAHAAPPRAPRGRCRGRAAARPGAGGRPPGRPASAPRRGPAGPRRAGAGAGRRRRRRSRRRRRRRSGHGRH